ncbi:MAG: hypothetical protein AMK73_05400 [Planctomycetes bacterium SM23_32]|nr:MAG: hypothetical protein AMK73_05400 [Planctomycetes bacterium SM23_32]
MDPADSTTTTKLIPASGDINSDVVTEITLGESVRDTATVTGLDGVFPMPTGTVDFQVVEPGEDPDNESDWDTFDPAVALDLDGVAISVEYTPSAAGDYYFRAIYSGDSNYNGSQSGNREEPLVVTGGYEGKTPGFWKSHTDLWEGFGTGELVGDVFDIPTELSELADDTLLEALQYHGGKDAIGMARNLLRQAVAALLNASHPLVDYPASIGSIIADTNAALATLDRDAMGAVKDQFEEWNSLEGGIDAHGNPI